MDISILKDDGFAVWVPFMADAEVLIRHVPMHELASISTESRRRKWQERGTEAASHVDPVEAARLLGRAAVRGWRGMTMGGEEFPYGAENCEFLMTRWSGFSSFVASACTDVAALAERERRELEKKLSTT